MEGDPGDRAGQDGKLVDTQLQRVSAFHYPTREAGEFQDATGTLTISTPLLIWTTERQESATLRGGYLSLVVSQQLAASSYGHLVIQDGRGNLLMPLSPFCPDTPAGFVFRTEGNVLRFDLLEGNVGKLDSGFGHLYLATTVSIGRGIIDVASVCWGSASA